VRPDLALLRKLSVYFLLRQWETLEKTRECFSLDVVIRGTGRVWCTVGVWPERAECTGRSALDTGYLLCACPVLARVSVLYYKVFWQGTGRTGVSPVWECFADLSAHDSGGHWMHLMLRVRWGRVFAELSTHVTGEYQTRPVLTGSRPVVRRWPLEIDTWDSKVDTWLTLEHRTQRVERSAAPYWASGALEFCPVTEPMALSLWGAYKYEVADFGRLSLAYLITWGTHWAREHSLHSSLCLIANLSEIEWDSSALHWELHLVALDLWVCCGFLVTLGCFPTP